MPTRLLYGGLAALGLASVPFTGAVSLARPVSAQVGDRTDSLDVGDGILHYRVCGDGPGAGRGASNPLVCAERSMS